MNHKLEKENYRSVRGLRGGEDPDAVNLQCG
jgi:hypothetical protein